MPSLSFLDYVVLIGYFAAVIFIGLRFSKKQTSTEEYFLAGKSMSWLPLGISMYASLFSSISYLANPAETYQHDFQYFALNLIVPFAAVTAVILFVDFYSRLKIITIFQYLEMRFNGALRLLCSGIYMVARCLYAGIVLFALSMALGTTAGVRIEIVLLVVGGVSIVYTLLGGMKAVIWTDVMQFLILFGGVAASLCFVVAKLDGGVSELFAVANEHHKFRFINPQPFSLAARFTFWGIMAHGYISFLSQKGCDQLNVQRFLSGKSVGHSKMALILASFVSMPVQVLLYTLGVALFVLYLKQPDAYVQKLEAAGNFKAIFPYFIVSSVPAGLRGLLLGGLLAAAMSTVDSVLNTLSATSITDIYKRWICPNATPKQTMFFAKCMIVVWGVIITAAAFTMRDMQSILKMTNMVLGVFLGQLLGVFLLGMLSRRATSWGVLIGAIFGQGCVLLAKYKLLYVQDGSLAFSFTPGVGKGLPGQEINFTWLALLGAVATIIVGYLASPLFKAPDQEQIKPFLWKWRGWKSAFSSGKVSE